MSSASTTSSDNTQNKLPLGEIAEVDEFLDPSCWDLFGELDSPDHAFKAKKKEQLRKPRRRRFDSCEHFMDAEANQYLALEKA